MLFTLDLCIFFFLHLVHLLCNDNKREREKKKRRKVRVCALEINFFFVNEWCCQRKHSESFVETCSITRERKERDFFSRDISILFPTSVSSRIVLFFSHLRHLPFSLEKNKRDFARDYLFYYASNQWLFSHWIRENNEQTRSFFIYSFVNYYWLSWRVINQIEWSLLFITCLIVRCFFSVTIYSHDLRKCIFRNITLCFFSFSMKFFRNEDELLVILSRKILSFSFFERKCDIKSKRQWMYFTIETRK